MKNSLNEMFPPDQFPNIAEKMKYAHKNIFGNEYL